MDAVQVASSGHPGTPIALAPVVYQLWNRHLQFDPDDPIWPNRDRFLAGHLQLSNVCWIYDNNHITIEGHTDLAFSEDVAVRFCAYGWNVTRV